MRKLIPIFLIILFVVSGCKTTPSIQEEDIIEESTSTFTSLEHGEISIFPTYEYQGVSDQSDEKNIRKLYLWVNKADNKYIIVNQIIVREGTIPPGTKGIDPYGSLYSSWDEAVYTSIAERPYRTLGLFGIDLPPCFMAAVGAHIGDKEAIIRILIVPDKMCSENYQPVLEELNRSVLLDPLR